MTNHVQRTDVTPEYGGYTILATVLAEKFPNLDGKNLKKFTRQQVHVWWLRRDRNGFPAKHRVTVHGAEKELFRVSEVVSWFAGYVPATGGRGQRAGHE